jgi:tetratricopeptide (TPR) repeat protein
MIRHITKAIVLLTIAAGLAGCAKSETVRPDEPADKTRSFDGELITPRMKIYGTGINFRGVVNPEQAWQSAGNPPHYLILDGSGVYDRIAFSGMDNVYRLVVHIKQGGEWTLRYPVPVEENSAVLELESVSGDKLKLEFIGTNIAVENVSLYGVYDGKPDYTVAKSYDLSEKERELIRRSENAFVSKNYGEAIEVSREMIKLNPENPFPYMNLGQIYQGMAEGSEEHGEFLEIMERSMENYEAANMPENPSRLTLLDRTAKIYTYNLLDQEKAGETWEEYVMVMEASGEYSGNALASALTSPITSTKSNYDPEFESRMEKVIELVKKGEVREGNWNVYINLSRYAQYQRADRRNYEKSAEIAGLMIKNFSGFESKEGAWGHRELAVSLMALSRWEEAIDAWKGYYNHSIRDLGLLGVAYSYLRAGNDKKAYDYYILQHYDKEFQRNKDFFNDAVAINRKNIELHIGEFIREKHSIMVLEMGVEQYKELFKKHNISFLDKSEAEKFITKEMQAHLDKYNISY